MIRIIIALALMISQANAATRRSEPAAELKNGRYEISTDMGGWAMGYDLKFKEIERSGLVVQSQGHLRLGLYHGPAQSKSMRRTRGHIWLPSGQHHNR